MSLFIASLKMNGSNRIDGYTDVVCSFPDFFEQINHITGEKYGLV